MDVYNMTNEELEAVRQHHDMLIEKARLELRADKIRETCSADVQQQLLKPIEVQMRELDEVITHMAA